MGTRVRFDQVEKLENLFAKRSSALAKRLLYPLQACDNQPMKIESMRIGMKVRHPGSGIGVVRSLTEQVAEIRFDDGTRRVSPETSDLTPAEAHAAVSQLELPLAQLIAQTVAAVVAELGVETSEANVEELGARWHGGKLVLHPADPTLQTKEVPLEAFFHKIVMMRNNLRVLEQKLNSSDKMTDGEKVEWQQYITRCYGSMTTFNILFQRKEDQFVTGG